MVQVTFDTANDTIEELQDALRILETAIERRGGAPMATPEHAPAAAPSPAVAVAATIPRLDMPESGIGEPQEEAAVDTSFFKIIVKHESDSTTKSSTAKDHVKVPSAGAAVASTPKVPTLNQLLSESITEEELTRMFKQTGNEASDPAGKPLKREIPDELPIDGGDGNAYLEIVEYTDEKQ